MKTARELDERWQRNHNAALTRQALKAWAVQEMGGSCRICGYDRCLAALEFHHTNPLEKDFDISKALRRKMGRLDIQRELSRCVLLCSTCHRETHAGLHPQYLDRLEDGWD